MTTTTMSMMKMILLKIIRDRRPHYARVLIQTKWLLLNLTLM